MDKPSTNGCRASSISMCHGQAKSDGVWIITWSPENSRIPRMMLDLKIPSINRWSFICFRWFQMVLDGFRWFQMVLTNPINPLLIGLMTIPFCDFRLKLTRDLLRFLHLAKRRKVSRKKSKGTYISCNYISNKLLDLNGKDQDRISLDMPR